MSVPNQHSVGIGVDDSLALPTDDEAAQAVRTLIRWIGENPERQGLQDTPRRVLESYRHLFAGTRNDASVLMEKNFAQPDVQFESPVLIRNITVHSFCEHHILPIIGVAHVAYWPDQKLPGLSKIPRAVDRICRRMQTQERLTQDIGRAIDQALVPKGVAVIVVASHHCMLLRGVQERDATTETAYFSGLFAQQESLRTHITTRLAGS